MLLITEFALILWLKGQDLEIAKLQLWGNGKILRFVPKRLSTKHPTYCLALVVQLGDKTTPSFTCR